MVHPHCSTEKFEEVRLDQSSINNIKIIIQEWLEDAGGTWRIIEVIYKKQDRRIRDYLRRVLKMMYINVPTLNQNGARIWELDVEVEVIRGVSIHFAALKRDEVRSIFFIVALVTTLLSTSKTAILDMMKIAKVTTKLCVGETVKWTHVFGLITTRYLGVIASILAYSSEEVAIPKGSQVAQQGKSNV